MIKDLTLHTKLNIVDNFSSNTNLIKAYSKKSKLTNVSWINLINGLLFLLDTLKISILHR